MDNMLHKVIKSRLIAIVRGIQPEEAAPLFDALAAGGIECAEITLNTPQALEMIGEMRLRYGTRLSIGAGTVWNRRMAEQAIEAGAEFLVSPNVDTETIRTAIQQGVLPLPGAMTPTEIVSAVNAGAPVVKLFPCSSLGPSYVKELRGPLGHIPLLAVGGITKENAADYLRAGAIGVGIGSSLVSLEAIRQGNYEAIRRYAEELVQAIAQ